MKKIGMVVAVEINAAKNKYGEPEREFIHGNMTVSLFKTGKAELYVCHTGVGEIGAAAGTQLLISLYNVNMIINFGVVGGLTPEMALAASCIVEKAVHYDNDSSAVDPVLPGQYPGFPDIYLPADRELLEKALAVEPTLKKVICASADRYVDGEEKKSALHNAYNADICDMESAAIILTCCRNNIPCLLIKTVSDAVTGGAEGYLREMERTSGICIDIADRLIGEIA